MDLSAYVNQSLTFIIGYICQNLKHLQLYYTIFTVKIKENTYELGLTAYADGGYNLCAWEIIQI